MFVAGLFTVRLQQAWRVSQLQIDATPAKDENIDRRIAPAAGTFR